MQNDFANAKSTNAKMIPVIDISGAISGLEADAIYNAAINHIYQEPSHPVPWNNKSPKHFLKVDKQAILGQKSARLAGARNVADARIKDP